MVFFHCNIVIVISLYCIEWHITARQLREFAHPTEQSVNSYCTPTIRSYGWALPGVIHRLIVPVMAWSCPGGQAMYIVR